MTTLAKAAGYACLAVILWLRFTNADLTETQLFLRFWPVWTICVAVMIGAIVLLRKE